MISDHLSFTLIRSYRPSALERKLDQITERRRYDPVQRKLAEGMIPNA